MLQCFYYLINLLNGLNNGMKTHYCHIVFFWKVPCLNFNHVIIMKDFYNVLHIMINQNLKK
jgi:hypothetical protein